MAIGTLYYSHSTDKYEAEFTSIPFYDASITHNRDKASSMSFKSNVKLEEADKIIYQDLTNNKTFGGQVVKRSKTVNKDYNYEVIDYTRLYQSKVNCSYSNLTSSQILKKLLNSNPNGLSTAGIENTSHIHSYVKWDNASIWTIIEQLAWLEYKAGTYIYYDVDYTGGLIWKEIPEQVEGYRFTEAYDYNDSHDSSDIITQGVLINSNKPSEHIDAYASQDMIAKWGYVSEIVTCTPPSKNNSSNKSKSSCKKSSSSTQYYSKCGLSPDKKTIVSVAKPSGPDAGKYGYRLYRTVFENYCPICKKKGYLRFDGGKKTKCITSEGAGGAGYKASVQAEHEITCVACDSDYCGVTGAEKWYTIRGRLKTVKKPVKSSQKEFNQLTSGKLVYQKGTTSKCESKSNASGSLKNEKNIKKYDIAKSVWQKALEITNPKKSEYQNAKAIFKWQDSHCDWVNYRDTHRGASGCLKQGGGNCCDNAHLFIAMCRSIGIKARYIHNTCLSHVYSDIYLNGKWIIVDTGRHNASWGGHWNGGSSTSSSRSCQTYYDKLPF